MKIIGHQRRNLRNLGFTLGGLEPVKELFGIDKKQPTEEFKPREDVITYLGQQLRAIAFEKDMPYNDVLIRQIREGTPIGRSLYSLVERLYERVREVPQKK